MLEEFEELTGFYPSADMYDAIELEYADFPGDKYAFCEAYKANKDGLAERIQQRASEMTVNGMFAMTTIAGKRTREIALLKKRILELEGTLENWLPEGLKRPDELRRKDDAE